MAQTIQIKRSTATAAPSTLAAGELAYSHVTTNGKLYIGRPGGAAGDVDAIGGKYYIDRSEAAYGWGDHSTEGYLVATSAGYNNTEWDNAYTYSQVGHLPSAGGTVTGNITISGTVDGRDVATDGTKLDGIETGATGDQTNAEIRTAVGAASDSNVFTDADHTKLNGIAASANNYSHPSAHTIGFITGLQAALDGKVDDSQVLTDVPSGAVFIDTTYSVGDGGLTQKNFTTTLKNKLDGIAASANNYSLPLATATARGGIELFSTTDQSVAANAVSTTLGRTYGIQLNSDDQAVVNIPWTDTNTTYSVGDGGLTQKNFTTTLKSKLDGIAASANNYSLTNLNAHLAAGVGNIVTSGYIRGPAAMVIDPAAHADATGSLTILGDLVVEGTTTTINSTVVEIADERVVVNREQTGTPTSALVAGLEVERGTSTNAYLLWRETNSGWYVSDGGAVDFELLHANNWSTSYTGVVEGGSF